MIFNIINTIILFIVLIIAMCGVIVGIRIKNDDLTVLCGICAGLIGMLFGLALSSIFFNF